MTRGLIFTRVQPSNHKAAYNTHQHTSLLAIIPLVGSVLLILNKEILRCPLKHISGLAVCALLGLLPYAYLVLRAHKGPYPGSWGDQRTVSGFLRHVLRAEYGTFKMLTFGAAKEKGATKNNNFMKT